MDLSRDPGNAADDPAREERIKRLLLGAVSACGSCKRAYSLDSFAIVGHREHLWMVAVACAQCHTRGFITAVIDGHELDGRSPTRPSPLTSTDRDRFAAAPVVAVDDLLDLHTFLDDFDGDFATLFGRHD